MIKHFEIYSGLLYQQKILFKPTKNLSFLLSFYKKISISKIKSRLMSKLDLRVDFLDSSLSLQERESRIQRFERGDTWILISTDVLARGIDFRSLKTVINYDFPTSRVDYIHRVGRTGRAGKAGKALTFFTEADRALLPTIATLMRDSGVEVPSWMLDLTPLSKSNMKKIQKYGVKREEIIPNSGIRKNREKKKFFKEMKKKDYQFHQSRDLLKKRGELETPEDEPEVNEAETGDGYEEMLKKLKDGDLNDGGFQTVDANMMAQLGIEISVAPENKEKS